MPSPKKLDSLIGEPITPFARKSPDDRRPVFDEDKLLPASLLNLSEFDDLLEKVVVLLEDPKFLDPKLLKKAVASPSYKKAKELGYQEVWQKRYLWVLMANGVLICLEVVQPGDPHPKTLYKHSSLTEGGKAYAGGEFWFGANKTVYYNHHSGRYGLSKEVKKKWEGAPRENKNSRKNMKNILVRLFKHFGWQVVCIDLDG